MRGIETRGSATSTTVHRLDQTEFELPPASIDLESRQHGKQRPFLAAVDVWAAIAALGLACVVRMFEIGHQSIWLDEGYTLLFSGFPLDRLILVGGAHEHPPLYYLLVHAGLSIQNSWLVPRVLSAAAGSACVVVLYFLGRRLYGRIPAVIASGLLIVSPFHTWYSQDGRAYELAGLFVLVSYYAVCTALEGRRQWWLIYTCSLALCLYTEYTTVLVLIPQIFLLVRARARGDGKSLVGAWMGAGILFSPWIGILLLDASSIASKYWIPIPTWQTFSGTVLEFVGLAVPCGSPPCSVTSAPLPLLHGHAGSATILVLAWLLVFTYYAVKRRELETGMLVAWLVFPFLTVFALSITRSLYLDRIFLDCTFPLYLIIGRSVQRALEQRWKIVSIFAVLLVMCGCSLWGVGRIYQENVNPDWKTPARDFALAYRPGQSVVYYPGVVKQLISAYLPSAWHAARETPVWARTYLDVAGWQSRYKSTDDFRLRDMQLAAAASGHQKVWLITQGYTGLPFARRWFTEHGFRPAIGETYDGDTRVELYDRLPDRPLGPAVIPLSRFPFGWSHTGVVIVGRSVAREQGRSSISCRIDVQPGAYSVDVWSKAGVPSQPQVSVTAFDAKDRMLSQFPKTKWYDVPVQGVWLRLPFGFIAPPGTTHVTIRLSTLWGVASWRGVQLFREAGHGISD